MKNEELPGEPRSGSPMLNRWSSELAERARPAGWSSELAERARPAGPQKPTLVELIDNPALLSEETLTQLQALVDEHPEYQAARMLLVQNLYQLHHPDFTAQLRKAALMLPHPEVLYQLIEPQLMPQQSQRKETATASPATERTTALIEQFLAGVQRAETSAPTSAPSLLPSFSDVTSDYAAFLAQQPDQPNEEETTEEMARKAQLIEQFIEQTKGQQRYQLPELPEEEDNGFS